MSKFIDLKDYYFNLIGNKDGIFLEDVNNKIKINSEIAGYYLKNYSLQKGRVMNVFRKIECDDGEIRFYGKEHPEYKDAEKEEEISIKSLDIGDVLSTGNEELIYIGSFYKQGNTIKKLHTFYNKQRRAVIFSKNIKQFRKVINFDGAFSDKVYNYEKYISNNLFRKNNYKITRQELTGE